MVIHLLVWCRTYGLHSYFQWRYGLRLRIDTNSMPVTIKQ